MTTPNRDATFVTGTVTKRDRMALPPEAVVNVQLQDVSRADAPAEVLGTFESVTNGAQVPIPYAIEYDAGTIDPRMRYAVRATFTFDGALKYTSTTVIPVITHGAPTTDVEIVVQPAG